MNDRASAQPLVSIVLPTYKRAHVLPSAISSVLNQTHANLELIVVDDNSPDETRDVVASFSDPRIRYVRNDPNLKLPRTLNRGFSLSRGDYLTWTSDDNLYAPTAIERMVDVIRNDKTIRERMIAVGVEPLGEPSAKAEAFFDEELVRWKDVIDRAGIKLDK